MSNPPSVLSHRTSKSSLGTQGTKLLSTFLSDHVREYLDRRVLEQNQAILSKDPPQDTDELIWDIPTLDTCIIESFAVIVMADVSGYSRLTSVMSERGKTGFELLTKTMKDYLDNIVDIVMAHNGDIIKFAGDAVLFYWKLDAKERRNTCIASKTNSCNCPKCLKGEVVLRAALCCTDLLKRLGRYEINIEGCDVKHLSIHLGIGAGNLMDVHAKGNEYRFEHFVAGDAVNQLMAVLNDAKPALSIPAWDLLSNVTDMSKCRVVSRQEQSVVVEDLDRAKTKRKLAEIRMGDSNSFMENLDRVPALIRYGLYEKYITSPVIHKLKGGFDNLMGLTEIRQVTTLFVKLGGFQIQERAALAKILTAFNVINEIVEKYEGVLRQLLVDDKGATMLILFGLPPLSHQNDAVYGTTAALEIAKMLANESFSIGVTTGEVAIGGVGSTSRTEYALMGDSINMAARLMCLPEANSSILCDAKTFLLCRDEMITFNEGSLVKVKGKEALFKVYTPLKSSTDAKSHTRNEQSQQGAQAANTKKADEYEKKTAVIGREKEIDLMRQAMERHLLANPSVLVIQGQAGSGMSTLAQLLKDEAANYGFVCCYSSASEINKRTPFYVVQDLICDLMIIIHSLHFSRTKIVKPKTNDVAEIITSETNALNSIMESAEMKEDEEPVAPMAISEAAINLGKSTNIGLSSDVYKSIMPSRGVIGSGMALGSQKLSRVSLQKLKMVSMSPRLAQKNAKTSFSGGNSARTGSGAITPPNRRTSSPTAASEENFSKTALRPANSANLIRPSSAGAKITGRSQSGQVATPASKLSKTSAISQRFVEIKPESDSSSEEDIEQYQQEISVYPTRKTFIGSTLMIDDEDENDLLDDSLQSKLRLMLKSLGENPNLSALFDVIFPGEFKETLESQTFKGRARMRECMELIKRLLNTVSTNVACMIIIEEAQWLDGFSWQLIGEVFNSCKEVMLCVFTRDPKQYDLVGDENIFKNIVQASRTTFFTLQNIEMRHMEPLLLHSIRMMVKKGAIESLPTMPVKINEGITKFVYERSAGNPLFVKSIIRAIIENKMVAVDEELELCWSMLKDARVENSSFLPVSDLQSLITTQFDKLDHDFQQFLKVASVIGEQFLVEDVMVLLPAEVNEAIMNTDFFNKDRYEFLSKEESDGIVMYSFRSSLIRNSIYSLMHKEQREQLHLQLAQHYEHLLDNVGRIRLLIPVYDHYKNSGNKSKAMFYLEEVCHFYYEAGSAEDTIKHYKILIETRSQGILSIGDRLKIAKWYRELGEAYSWKQEYAEAKAFVVRSLRILRFYLPETAFVNLIAKPFVWLITTINTGLYFGAPDMVLNSLRLSLITLSRLYFLIDSHANHRNCLVLGSILSSKLKKPDMLSARFKAMASYEVYHDERTLMKKLLECEQIVRNIEDLEMAQCAKVSRVILLALVKIGKYKSAWMKTHALAQYAEISDDTSAFINAANDRILLEIILGTLSDETIVNCTTAMKRSFDFDVPSVTAVGCSLFAWAVIQSHRLKLKHSSVNSSLNEENKSRVIRTIFDLADDENRREKLQPLHKLHHLVTMLCLAFSNWKNETLELSMECKLPLLTVLDQIRTHVKALTQNSYAIHVFINLALIMFDFHASIASFSDPQKYSLSKSFSALFLESDFQKVTNALASLYMEIIGTRQSFRIYHASKAITTFFMALLKEVHGISRPGFQLGSRLEQPAWAECKRQVQDMPCFVNILGKLEK